MKELSSKKKIEIITEAALSKKAKDIVLIDLRKHPSVCDYFVITTGESTVQIDTIADNIEKSLLEKNCKIWSREGRREALWILLDYGDVVVHIFYKETRGFYHLEKLWYDAPQKKLTESSFGKKGRKPKKK